MKPVRVIKALSVAVLVGIVLVLGAGPTSQAGNRCTDHCADRYKVARDACRLIPLKTERKICERRLKEVKEDCKRSCR